MYLSFRLLLIGHFTLMLFSAGRAQAISGGDATGGKIYFTQNCAICHADALGAGNVEMVRQGPSLVGVFGRRAGATTGFNYTKAISDSGLIWDAPTLNHFLASPSKVVPGTTMPIAVADDKNRQDVIAYLATLHASTQLASSSTHGSTPSNSLPVDSNDWQQAAPGVKHHLTLSDLPAPYSTASAGNGPKVVAQPAGAELSVPPGFKVKLFAKGFENPRLVRIAPNGDIFIAESAANRIHVLRATDGADAPSENQVFVEGLDRPFGIAFYPLGNNPKWIYVANNNSIVRFPYHNGDLTASGLPQIIIPQLCQSGGGHITRDLAFSKDGKRMFISVGSSSNVAESMSKKTPEAIRRWEADHGLGAAWDSETNRADILVTDPEGHKPLHTFGTGIRNGVGIAINPETGDLWTSTNERDGLGDNLVPDYITRVKPGGYYGWPWYYLGNYQDPRHAGERPDLAGKAIVPDVLLQAHSASLEMAFYPDAKGSSAFPAEFIGDAFAAFHGSWNRSSRTGYKVVRVRLNHGIPTGEYDDFLTGFVVDNASVWGRPVGVAVAHDGALVVTEDGNNSIWRISYSDKQ